MAISQSFNMTKQFLLVALGVIMINFNYGQMRAAQNIQQNESLITSSSYGLYFRGFNGAEVTFDNNGKPKLGGLDLESIPGELYWNNSYAPAKLYLKDHKLLGEFNVRFEKLNQVFYVKLEEEGMVKAVDPSLIESIEFSQNIMKWNMPVFTNNFFELSSKTKGLPSGYMQVLEKGILSLLKSNKSVIRYRDSLFGAIKKPYLVPQETYYLFYKGEFKEIKKLSFKQLNNAFPDLENEFLKVKTKSDLSEEDEFVSLLSQINLQLKNKEKK